MTPAIFLKAADLIAKNAGRCCCWTISEFEVGTVHEQFFIDVFSPRPSEYTARDYNAFWMQMGCSTDTEARDRRVFALCLAAAIAADGGL